MKRYLLPFVAALIALLALGWLSQQSDARCYVDPFTGQKVCEQAVQTVKPLAIKPGERSVVVKRTKCNPRCRIRLLRRWFR